MKELVDYFAKKGQIYKSIIQIDKAELKIRKKIDIFCATDMKGNYHVMYVVGQKSRFLMKDIDGLMLIDEKVQELQGHNFRYRHLMRSNPTCSKAKEVLLNRGWKIHNDFM